jgi:hypothetical protein
MNMKSLSKNLCQYHRLRNIKRLNADKYGYLPFKTIPKAFLTRGFRLGGFGRVRCLL